MLGAYIDGDAILKTDLPELDVTDGAAVRRLVHLHRPELFLHLAALTDVDQCELQPELAERVNVVATRNVAEACAETGCAMLYMSTAQVFAGTKPSGYVETDATGPLNAYGRTKLAGEEVVRATVDKHYIVRTSWLMGGGADTEKKFVGKLLELMKSGRELRVVDDKRGSPTYARDLAETVRTLTESGRFGTYHVANRGWCTRYELARVLADLTGAEVSIRPVPSTEFPLPAPRPDSEVLLTAELAKAGLPPLRPWQEALTGYLREWGY
jgi:dTDP-4-dehydrorhamnose reductase